MRPGLMRDSEHAGNVANGYHGLQSESGKTDIWSQRDAQVPPDAGRDFSHEIVIGKLSGLSSAPPEGLLAQAQV